MKLSQFKIGDTFNYQNIDYIYAGCSKGVYFAYHAITIKVEFYNDVEVKKL